MKNNINVIKNVFTLHLFCMINHSKLQYMGYIE